MKFYVLEPVLIMLIKICDLNNKCVRKFKARHCEYFDLKKYKIIFYDLKKNKKKHTKYFELNKKTFIIIIKLYGFIFNHFCANNKQIKMYACILKWILLSNYKLKNNNFKILKWGLNKYKYHLNIKNLRFFKINKFKIKNKYFKGYKKN